MDYDYGNMPTRKIDKHDDLKWHSMDYFLSEALRGERIGLKIIGKKRYEAWFCEHLLGIIDEETEPFTPQLAKGGKKRIIYAKRKVSTQPKALYNWGSSPNIDLEQASICPDLKG